MSRPGDGGADYLYSVSTSYDHLRRLADFLAARAPRPPAPPDAPDETLQDLVAACLRALLDPAEPEIRAGRDRVRELFVEAGVGADVDNSHWVNFSDD